MRSHISIRTFNTVKSTKKREKSDIILNSKYTLFGKGKDAKLKNKIEIGYINKDEVNKKI